VPLLVDPIRMGQVLSNLLVNAAKYTDEGRRIDLSGRTERDQCVIEVTDSGRGLDDDDLASMFDMFWRSSKLDVAGSHSMGIGLALVRSVVSMHEGSVGATSPGPGRGSTFTIRLPMYTPSPDEVPPSAPAAAPARTEVADLRGRRILIADDNEDVAWTLSQVLSSAGCEVRTARDGEEALALARAFEPDVAVLDIGMAGMSGYEVGQRLRDLAGGREMLVIAATGWGSESDRQASAAAGFDAHLIKPVSPAELMNTIRDAGAARNTPPRGNPPPDGRSPG